MTSKLDETMQRTPESHEECAHEIERLGLELARLQREARTNRLPTIVLFEGWEAAGKGTLINRLALTLDPRGYRVMTVQSVTEQERLRAPLYRFWRDLPEPGQIVLYDRSWYDRIWRGLAEQRLSKLELQEACFDVAAFEQTLANQGYLVVKLFLHISKREQAKRFRALRRSRSTSWRIDASDLRQHNHFKRWKRAVEKVMARTCGERPFLVIDAEDRHQAAVIVIRELVRALGERLARQPATDVGVAMGADPHSINVSDSPGVDGAEPIEPLPASPAVNEVGDVLEANVDTIEATTQGNPRTASLGVVGSERITSGPDALSSVDLTQRLDRQSYEAQLMDLKARLRELEHQIYRRRTGVVIGFEGWDAAGKGGSIRRLVSALDPRGYEVIPIGAPSAHEAGMHYLWRFACRLPKAGHIAIFDRTWYGRVLVERVEQLTSEPQWRVAYDEIKAFERHLVSSGHVLVKFWLHMDAEEQLTRFRARESTPEKCWKITEEDWRNREKRPKYEAAVEDMLELTGTTRCPWTVVPANDKLSARITTLRATADAISARLDD